MTATERIRRALRTVRPKAEATADGLSRTQSHRGKALLDANLFDQEFYETQAEATFANEAAAVEHWCTTGLWHYSPHPLIDLSYLPPRTMARLREVRTAVPLLRYLRRSTDQPTGPLFDPSPLRYGDDDLATEEAGALGRFVRGLSEATPLPGRPGLTYGAARAELLHAIRAHHAERHESGGEPFTTVWDADAERAWLDRWRTAPLPEVDGPLVSIVMPVRNRPHQVVDAIASVQAQTLSEWELLVVDDGSQDETPEVVAALAALDPRIRLIREPWSGVCAARNAGIHAASGSYVAFLDSDNTWFPHYLRTTVAVMHGQSLGAAYAALTYTGPDGMTRYRAHAGGYDHLMSINHVDLNVLVAQTALIRAVGGFDPALRRWVDHDLVIRIAKLAEIAYLPFLAVSYDNRREQKDRISTTESGAWKYVVLDKHWSDWDEVQRRLVDRTPGRVSIVVVASGNTLATQRCVRAIDRSSAGHDVEVVAVDNGLGLSATVGLHGLLADHGARIVRLPRPLNASTAANVGFARSTGEFVIFLSDHSEPRDSWLGELVPALAEDGVLGAQPLVQQPNEAIRTAGTAFAAPGRLPTHFLAGHPAEDADRMPAHDFAAVSGSALLMRATDLAALRGFDPLYINGLEDVDLCLRARDLRGGTFRVVTTARVVQHEPESAHRPDRALENRRLFARRWRERLPGPELHRWHDLGFTTPAFLPDPSPIPVGRPLVLRQQGALHGATPLRWGVCLPAASGELALPGDATPYSATVDALRGLGHEVVLHRVLGQADASLILDDVVLGVRGADPMAPVPGKMNVLWVVSDPDQVPVEELLGFDLVLAASSAWATDLAQRADRTVQLLSGSDEEQARALTDAVDAALAQQRP